MDESPGRFPPPPERPLDDPSLSGGTGQPGTPRDMFPLTVDRALQMTFSLWRFNAWAFIGAALLVMAPAALLLLGSQALVGDELARAQQAQIDIAAGRSVDLTEVFPARALIVTYVGVVLSGIAGFVAQAALAWLTAEVVNGRKPGALAAVRAALGRFKSLAAAVVVVLLAVLVIVAFGVAAGAGLIIGGSLQPGILVFVGLIVLVATVALLLFVMVRWSLAGQAVILDGESAVGALRRSWRLVAGSSWRVFGYVLVFGLITGVVALLIRAVSAALVGSGMSIEGGRVVFEAVPYLVSSAIDSVFAIVLMPLPAIGMTLLFMDLRWRRQQEEAGLAGTPAPRR